MADTASESRLGSSQHVLLAVLALVSWGCGVVGFWDSGWTSALYQAAQLFVLGINRPAAQMNAWVEAARWGAAASTSWALAEVVWQIVAVARTRTRLQRASDHVVIRADGDVAVALARAFRAQDQRAAVWVAAEHEDTVQRVRAEAPGVKVVQQRSEALVDSAALVRARQVVIVGSDDAESLALAARVCEAARGRRTRSEPLVCRVQIRSVNLRESLRRFSVPAEQSHSYVHTFDFFEHSVRRLLTTTLPIDGSGITEDDPHRVHLVVLGDDDWGLTVVATAARVAHFANRRPLQLSVVTRDAAGWEARRNASYPALGEVCDYHVVQPQGYGRDALRHMLDSCDREDTRLIAIACPVDDAAAIELVADWSQVVTRPDIPLAVRVSQARGLEAMFRDRAQSDGLRLVLFGWFDESACASFVQDDEREKMARLAQVKFRKLAESQRRQQLVDRAVAEWSQLAKEDYKESNRQQVDHIAIKLRAVRCEIAEPDDRRPEAIWTHEEVEVLSEMEHARWVAERRLGGWTFAEGPKNERARTSPSLVTWDQLTEPVKDYDRDAVLNIPDLVRQVTGRKIAVLPSCCLKICRRG